MKNLVIKYPLVDLFWEPFVDFLSKEKLGVKEKESRDIQKGSSPPEMLPFSFTVGSCCLEALRVSQVMIQNCSQ